MDLTISLVLYKPSVFRLLAYALALDLDTLRSYTRALKTGEKQHSSPCMPTIHHGNKANGGARIRIASSCSWLRIERSLLLAFAFHFGALSIPLLSASADARKEATWGTAW